MVRWLWRVRLRDDRRLFKGAVSAPPEIDPIEELSRSSARPRSATRRTSFALSARPRTIWQSERPSAGINSGRTRP